MKIEIPNIEDTNVICIETFRKNYFSTGECIHNEFKVYEELATVECGKCGKQLNPIFLLTKITQEWERFIRLRNEYKEASKLYEEKKRTKCDHCHQMTSVNPPKDFSKRLRLLTKNSCP